MQRKLSSTGYPIVFFMADSADHVTGKTGLSPSVTISKNGGAFGAASGAVSELSNGWYALAGNATDRGTLGALAVHASASGADPADVLVEIVSHDPFEVAEPGDAMTLTSDERTSIGTAVWATTTRTLSGFGTLVADMATAVWSAATRTLTSGGSITAADVWSYATRALTDKANFTLTSAYDAAKTAVTVGDLTGATVYLSGPMTTGNEIRIVRGDDYFGADDRALTWTFADIDLSGMTAVFSVGALSIDCDIVGGQVTAELAADDTSLLTARNYEYRLALFSGGHKLTEIIANCAVL